MMRAPLMTAEQVMELPDDGRHYELSQGRLLCMAPSSYKPGKVVGKIMWRLSAFVEQHQLGEYGSAETGFRLATNPDTVRAPDVWFVRAERTPADDDAISFYPGARDLAVEALSPTDRFADVTKKVHEYLTAATPLVWVLDSRADTAAVFRPGERVRFLSLDESLDGEDVLPGFELPLRELFG